MAEPFRPPKSTVPASSQPTATSVAHQRHLAFNRITNEKEIEELKQFISRLNLADPNLSASREADINSLIADITYIKESFEKLGGSAAGQLSIDPLTSNLLSSLLSVKSYEPIYFTDGTDNKNFNTLLQIVAKIKLRVPRIRGSSSSAATSDQPESGNTDGTGSFPIQFSLNDEDAFRVEMVRELERHCWGIKGLLNAYECLPTVREKVCLLSFAIFPWHEQGAVIKKRVLFYWWAGERFIDPETEEKTIEDTGNEILDVLTDKGFVEPVVKKGLVSNACRMHPVVRSLVVLLAKRVGMFDIDDKGDPKPEFIISKRALLLKSQGKSSPSSLHILDDAKNPDEKRQYRYSGKLEHIQTLFNLNETFLDIKSEWFSEMKYLSVLHLGRWRWMPKQHIEVREPEVLDHLTNMKQLRLLSMQGVSPIMKLPDAVCDLVNLLILDLRACHNLEDLPTKIGSLKNLTHLDVSDCHLLIKMPKGIGLLSKLQVLKGFVISYEPDYDYDVDKTVCTVHDLAKLENLRTLSIFVKREKEFPAKLELRDFKVMKKLSNLKISWERIVDEEGNMSTPTIGQADQPTPDTQQSEQQQQQKSGVVVGSNNNREGKIDVTKESSNKSSSSCYGLQKGCYRWIMKKNEESIDPAKCSLPDQLQKLDLRCMPDQIPPPTWLVPAKLNNLKKLYIRGGNLTHLGNSDDKWNVRTLRLKFLLSMKIKWKDLNHMFPHLEYLEKYRSPKLAFFPCDEDGVWRKHLDY